MAKKMGNSSVDMFRCEHIDRGKLSYIMRHFDKIIKPLLKISGDEGNIAVRNTYFQYLTRCDSKGFLKVCYKQEGNGRWYAMESISMQAMLPVIRNTIAGKFYSEISIENATISILDAMLNSEYKLEKKCYSHIAAYIGNMDKYHTSLMNETGCTCADAKRVYMQILTGGNAVLGETLKSIQATKMPTKVRKFTANTVKVHAYFANKAKNGIRKPDFDEMVRKMLECNQDVTWFNLLLHEKENEILQGIWKELGGPHNCVLCFDRIMVSSDVNLSESLLKRISCTVSRATGCKLELKLKPMNEVITLPKNWESDMQDPAPEMFYHDYCNLLKSKKEFTAEEIDSWGIKNMVLLTNHGQAKIAIRDTEVVVDGYWTETYIIWKPQLPRILFDSLDQKCCVLKPEDEGDGDESGKVEYYFKKNKRTLGHYVKMQLYKENKLFDAKAMMHVPYLHKKPDLGKHLNSFGGFPLLRIESTNTHPFANSIVYGHWRDHFFRDETEFKHFLAHLADCIQRPARKPTNSVHVFYEPDGGTGKSHLSHAATRLLGTKNTIIIDDAAAFVKNQFNSEYTGRIVRIYEEVPESHKDSKQWDKLKNIFECKRERKHQKYEEGVEQAAFDRNWLMTNNPPTFVNSGPMARRCTVHHLKGSKANIRGKGYWGRMWKLLDNPHFMRSMFDFFATYKYTYDDVGIALDTQIKTDMLRKSVGNAVTFLINLLENGEIMDCVVQPKNDKAVSEDTFVVNSETLNEMYKMYCADSNIKWHRMTMLTQFNKIGIKNPEKILLDCGSTKKVLLLKTHEIEKALQKRFREPGYKLILHE